MDFQIKLYRWPHSANDVILIGRGQLGLEAAKANIPEADESLYKALKHLRQLPPLSFQTSRFEPGFERSSSNR